MRASHWLLGCCASGLLSASIGCGTSEPPAQPPQSPTTTSAVENDAPGTGAVELAQSTPEQNTSAPPPQQPAAPAMPAIDARPEEIVRWFLEATRRGDDQIAAAMLSRKSLEETARRGLSVKPPGSPTMKYTIAEAQQAPNDGAYVKCLWTDTGELGDEENIEVVWILGLRPQGWRITGMAAELPNSEEPIIIDFENPEGLAERVGGQDESGGVAETPQEPAYNAGQPNEGIRR